MKKSILSFVILLSISYLSIGQSTFDKKLAQRAYETQDFEQSLKYYNSCVEEDSTNISCFEKAAMSAYKLGDIPQARSTFIELEKIDSTNRLALSQLAIIYEQEKNAPKAIKYYHKLVKLFPTNSIYFRKLAQNYQGASLMTDAFKYYSEAYKLNKRDLFTIKGLSEIFLTNKQYIDADSIMRKGLKLDTLNISLHLLLAQSKYKQKLYDSTIHYLDRIKYKIDFSPYYNKMFGYSYIQIDSFRRSIPPLEKSLLDAGTKEYSHYYLATAYYRLDSMEYAMHHYKEALKEGISDNVDLYHRSLAKMYNDDNQLKVAIEHYKDAYKYGNDPLVLFYLARACEIYYKDKNIAINYYKKYIKSGHDHPEYQNYASERKRHLLELKHQKM